MSPAISQSDSEAGISANRHRHARGIGRAGDDGRTHVGLVPRLTSSNISRICGVRLCRVFYVEEPQAHPSLNSRNCLKTCLISALGARHKVLYVSMKGSHTYNPALISL